MYSAILSKLLYALCASVVKKQEDKVPMTQPPSRSQTFFNEDGVAGLTNRAFTAAMGGAIAGALHGIDALRPEWVEQINSANRIA